MTKNPNPGFFFLGGGGECSDREQSRGTGQGEG